MKPGSIPLACLLALCLAPPAVALDWQPAQTLKLVRGYPEPRVAIDASGKSTVVYSQGLEGGDDGSVVDLYARAPGPRSDFFEPGLLPGRSDAAIAVNPAGAMAIATVDAGQLNVTLYPAPGPKPTPPWDGPQPEKLIVEGALSVAEPQVAIDGAGAATVVWASPPSPKNWTPVRVLNRVYAVTVSPPGVVGPVQELGGSGPCAPEVDVNLRGDTVVSGNCSGTPADVFYRPAGGGFGAAESVPGFESGPNNVTIDGAGNVLAVEAFDRSPNPRVPYDYQAYYSVRPPSGPFGPRQRLAIPSSAGQLRMESQEDGRTLMVWAEEGSIEYALRDANGAFGPARAVDTAGSPLGLALTAAPTGHGLIWWRELFTGPDRGIRSRIATSVLAADGTAEAPRRIGVPGTRTSILPPAFAINADGRAIGAWEQRCAGGGFAVMTVVRDDRRGGRFEPPCQDRSAPTIAIRPRQARFAARRVRVRVGCDEPCTLGVRVRVLRRGRGRPLATGRLRKGRIGAGRYRIVRIRVRPRQAAALRRALARRERLTTRLAVSVRDAYGNGAVRRLAVPLRR